MDCNLYTINEYITITSDAGSIVLRQPEIGNSHEIQTNMTKNKMVHSRNIIFKRDVAKAFERLHYSFKLQANNGTITGYENFITWYRLSAGEEMTLIDLWNQSWIGTIIDTIEVKQYDYTPGLTNCKSAWGLIFEGILQ